MEVIFKQLVNKAAKGDHKSTQLLMAYLEKRRELCQLARQRR